MNGAPVPLHHVIDGSPDAPALLLGPSLGTTLAMWEPQVERLARRYRVVQFDTRGHGRSPVPPGPYSLNDLVADVLGLADSLGLDRFSYAGVSLGGAVGQQLAAAHPERVTALLLCATGPSFGGPDAWHDRASRVRARGMGWLVEPTRERWFPPWFIADCRGTVDAMLETLAQQPPEGYAACCEALADCNLGDTWSKITAPTRVIAGASDPVSGPAVAQPMANGISGADLVVIDEASHIVNRPRPQAFTDAVLEHLEKHSEQ